ncbi:MAG TPA: class I SAM-dependent methyltransferase [Mycobacterium sp.]|uniref:class I SAM-dependent methyltransferase n=1 Tax=Mycobacterium sp. TaxID=1785 RepID=UPI002CE86326|nr:class I SAM-dependent methyltransferase [Mycobacterium sp.]HME78232.1 class I SAM-dependent methyltransferase [Mycobacterium sp.]
MNLAGRIDDEFHDIVRTRPGARILDIGGRARSGVDRRGEYPGCDLIVFDRVADPTVDVVGDAHALSSHFPAESFDFIVSIAVFEHLLISTFCNLRCEA